MVLPRLASSDLLHLETDAHASASILAEMLAKPSLFSSLCSAAGRLATYFRLTLLYCCRRDRNRPGDLGALADQRGLCCGACHRWGGENYKLFWRWGDIHSAGLRVHKRVVLPPTLPPTEARFNR